MDEVGEHDGERAHYTSAVGHIGWMGEALGPAGPKERAVPASAREHLDNVLRHAHDKPAMLVLESTPRRELRRETAAAAPAYDPANMVPDDAP